MLIDLNHLHFWMQAIRQSPDPIRTMDALWSGQLKSKEWLIKNLQHHIDKPVTIDIHGGWVGVLASMLFQSDIVCKRIRSIDIDPSCQPISTMMNKGEEIAGMFEAITANMCKFKSDADVVINTSCEHITQEQYEEWLQNVPSDAWIVLQSNDYFELEEHIRCSKDIDDFTQMSKIQPFYRGTLETPKYNRFMIIGRKK